MTEYLWYIPNDVNPGHRGDEPAAEQGALETLVAHGRAVERNGWAGALLGAGWGRPDTFTVATALAARTTRFEPLIAARPGFWQPAHLATAAATLDRLANGRVRLNIVSGTDAPAAYGDAVLDPAQRYARTKEFMRLLRRLWTEERLTFSGAFYHLHAATAVPRIPERDGRRHPRLYFGGASDAAERVAATEADVQLFWGEPLDGLRQRIDRLKHVSRTLDRDLPPLEFGLRITTLVRETSAQAWADAEAKVDAMARTGGAGWHDHKAATSVGQRRLLELQAQGDVLDDNLYTVPGRLGGGGAATTWLVGSAAEVAASLRKYRDIGITQFILSDTPYLREVARQGQTLLPLLRDLPAAVPGEG